MAGIMGILFTIRQLNLQQIFLRKLIEIKKSTTINHFYEKLLNLENSMNTSAGKMMAEKKDSLHEIVFE